MEFFLPEGSDQSFHLLAEQAKETGHRAIHSLKYQHEGSRYVVTIGASRREYKRKTGPRGGRIKLLEWSKESRPTGNPVQLIIDTGYPREFNTQYPILVYSIPGDAWGFPSLVGCREMDLGSIDYFDW